MRLLSTKHIDPCPRCGLYDDCGGHTYQEWRWPHLFKPEPARNPDHIDPAHIDGSLDQVFARYEAGLRRKIHETFSFRWR